MTLIKCLLSLISMTFMLTAQDAKNWALKIFKEIK